MRVKRLIPLALGLAAAAWAQVPTPPPPDTGKTVPYSISPSVINTPANLKFDVVSIKPSDPNGGRRGGSNVPLTAGERYAPNDGYFSATNQPLERYIAFAYDMDPNPDPQLKTLPDWVNNTRFDIEGRVGHPVGKDEMRAMMRNLLADRFQLTSHFEVRTMSVYTLSMAKPGKFGPQMREHVDDEGIPCDVNAPAAARGAAPAAPAAGATPAPAGGGGGRGQRATPAGYPQNCGELVSLPPTLPGRWRLSGRNITMDLFVVTLRGGMDRPVIDLTGLTGRYDWVLEYLPDVATDGQVGANFASSQGDPTAPKMWTALPQQLGLKLTATKMPVQFLVYDHIERPTGN